MKKLIILLLLPFFLTACYDYNELSNLAIVSGIAIDYENDEYEVTFEILSTKKEGDSAASSSSYNVSSKGTNLTEAFSKNGTLMDKSPYFEHVDVIVISEEIAKNHLKEVGEYIIRTSKLRNETYLTITTDKASEVIKTTSKEQPIAASFIVSLLENNKASMSASYYMPFTEILNSVLTDGEDAMISVISLKDVQDKKIIELTGLGVFKDYELKYIFNSEEASIINLLNNFDTETVYFTKKCGNGLVSVSIYEADIKLEPNNEFVNISGTLNGRIREDTCNDNLRDVEVYEKMQEEFAKIIANKMNTVLQKLQESNSNALNIGKFYYNKYRQPNYYLWTTQQFKYDLDLKINKKGLIFEVTK